MLEQVDLIITTRNRIQDLLFTIDHCLEIGFELAQFYIIDDASEDGTYYKVRTKYPDIRIERNPEAKGLITNRNTLMRGTQRPFVMSLDDDSHVRARWEIEEALALLSAEAHNGIFTFNAFEQLEEPPSAKVLKSTIREVRTYIGCGHIIKRSVIERLGNYQEAFIFYCEELDYSIRAYQAGYRVLTRDDLVVHHRIDWNARQQQTKSDLAKGIYGAIWRSKLGFSNNLLVVSQRYPVGLDFLFGLYYIALRGKNFLIKKRDVKGFFGGLVRFGKLFPQFWRLRDKMSFPQFRYWIRLSPR